MTDIPAIGWLVDYTLSKTDATAINVRRDDYLAFQAGHTHPHEPGQEGATGHQAHVGNQAAEGDVYPALVVRVFGTVPAANLQVFLDGNDIFWATSRVEGDEPGTWRHPGAVGLAETQDVPETSVAPETGEAAP